MRVIYTSKGRSKKFGVRVIYRKIWYLNHTAFSEQQWSHERTTALRYPYIAYVVKNLLQTSQGMTLSQARHLSSASLCIASIF
jgi:hypothetical protein